ncbi:MAG: phage minor tail protein L [Ferrovum sp.]|jgi:lambda family phage minor tail protein L|nr:phage minor tail protein L [Ferrovum sp.]
MSIFAEIQSLSPSALIELFVLDLTKQSGPVLYWHSGTNGLNQAITWNGQVYTPIAVQADGFKQTGVGALPRPRIRASNTNGVLAAMGRQYADFAGCQLTRIRTFARFLDAVNFPNGNPTADPTQQLPPEVWFFDRKVSEDAAIIEYELASALDMVAVFLPRRQYIQNSCPWIYRGADCGYTGTAMFTNTGASTTVASQDVCGKRLSDCALRFPPPALMNFGGFPGVGVGTQ